MQILLDRTCRKAADDVLLKEKHDQYRRDHRQGSPGGHEIPMYEVLADELGHGHRERFGSKCICQYEGSREHIPREEEGNYGDRDQAGTHHVNTYAKQCLQMSTAVDARRLFYLLGDGGKISFHKPGLEGNTKCKREENQADLRI